MSAEEGELFAALEADLEKGINVDPPEWEELSPLAKEAIEVMVELFDLLPHHISVRERMYVCTTVLWAAGQKESDACEAVAKAGEWGSLNPEQVLLASGLSNAFNQLRIAATAMFVPGLPGEVKAQYMRQHEESGDGTS